MQTIKCFPVRELRNRFNIPAVQRGLVWDAARICNLWDSLAKGYPIGSFIAYKEENDDRLQLLDGQQRLNSLLIAFGTSANADKADSLLWVKLKRSEENDSLGFMVCTPNNPWGFKENGDRFDASTRAEANKRFLNGDNNSDEDWFRIASVEKAFPWDGFADSHSDYVPMHLLCTNEPDFAVYMDYMKECKCEGVPKEIFDKLAQRAQDLLNTEIPVIITQNPPSNVIELFQRINKSGERLSGPDEIYSAICAYCGEGIKSENNNIAGGIMPPERLIQLALRMAKTIEDRGHLCATYIDVETVKKWFSEDKNKYAEQLKRLYEKDGETASCLGSLVAQTKQLLFNGNDPLPISIFLNTRYCWENWMLVLLLLLQKFGLDYFETQNKKHLKLLAMLPYVITSTTVTEKADRVFSETFYNAVRELTKETPLLELIAIGLSCVMLKCETFVFPWPDTMPAKDDFHRIVPLWVSNDIAYLDKWVLCVLKYGGTQENPLLFYYQRKYVNEIINGTHFNPAFRCATDVRNRPWDMDHIFPAANWQNDDDGIRNLAGNIQVMFFSDNRAKGNQCNGYSVQTTKGVEWFRYTLKEVQIDNGWLDFIENRLSAITRELYETLHISDLRRKINDLCDTNCESRGTYPVELMKAIERYKCFSEISKKHEVCFACLQYVWKQRAMSVDEADVAVLKIRDDKPIDFYESLTKSLALYPRGTSYGNALAQIWGTIEGNDVCYKVGIGRPFGIGYEEWHKNNDSGNWWKEPPSMSECNRSMVEEQFQRMLSYK